MTLRLNVSKHISFLLKIGGDIFLTAAHCLENWAGEVQEPSELSVYLGVHNRRDLEDAKYGSLVCLLGKRSIEKKRFLSGIARIP